MNDQWYSALLRSVIRIGEEGPVDGQRSVFLFRSSGFEAAFERALELGRAAETSYLNGDGELVQWTFVAVETIDQLGETIEDGREVYSQILDVPDEDRASDGHYAPEKSHPGQSGV